LFGQLFQETNTMEVSRWRNEGQAFKIQFRNEAGVDMGGPYREAMATICQELQSDTLPLFILTPNGQNNYGKNRDKYVRILLRDGSYLLIFMTGG
jgi:hypothetical protein